MPVKDDEEIDLNAALTILACFLWVWVFVLYLMPGAAS
jgi:hypothetical protein